MTVSLVPMTNRHIEELMPYEKAMFGTEAWTKSGYRSELADTALRHYIAAEDEDGRLLGWAGIMIVVDDAQILTIGVIPDARRQGIGQQLFDALLAEARRRGARAIFLEVRVDNEAALQLYRHNDFSTLRVRRGYYDHGRVDAVEMQRAL